MNEKIYFEISIDGRTNQYQLSIDDESGGLRIGGPKFNGSSRLRARFEVTERMRKEIVQMLTDKGEV